MHNIPSFSYNINAFCVALVAGKENIIHTTGIYVVELALTQLIARIDVSKSEIDVQVISSIKDLQPSPETLKF